MISVRNVGTGLAVMHGWRIEVSEQPQLAHPPLEDFTTQTRDIYLAARRRQRSVSAALADTRVVVINGARQTGKSTLARLIAAASPELIALQEFTRLFRLRLELVR